MANDLWRTPPEVYQNLNREFDFIADMAASHENALHNYYFTEKDDSFSFEWAEKLKVHIRPFGPSFVWCNPPYSNPKPWVKKALEAQADGLGVVMLLNADDSTEWFKIAEPVVSEIRRITGYYDENDKFKNGRLAFLDAFGKPIPGNNKAQFILVFDPFKVGTRVSTSVTKRQVMYPALEHGQQAA